MVAYGIVLAGEDPNRQSQADGGAALQADTQPIFAAGQVGPRVHRCAVDGIFARSGEGHGERFFGVDQDLKAFDRFIARYISVNQRWNSPKFLIGESYGTTRSAGLSDLLAEDGIQLNGIVLISSILNYGVRSPGYDTQYIINLPSYAAAAWYFDKVKDKTPEIAAWVQQAREFASGAYAQALFQGDRLSADQLDTVAKEMSRLTGLSVDYIKEANLRVSPTRFRKEDLRSDRKDAGPV